MAGYTQLIAVCVLLGFCLAVQCKESDVTELQIGVKVSPPVLYVEAIIA
jgi:hypothetical protein